MRVPWNYIGALIGGFILSIAFFIGCLYTQLGIPTETSHYIYDVTHAKELIAAKRSGRRLLIVGGSSALFGINADLIERETGYPTVNMGNAVGLNLDYRFYRLKKSLHPGDTVLLACEYELYTDKPDYQTIDDYVMARDPQYFRQMPLVEKLLMATRIPFNRLQKGWRILRMPVPLHVPIPPYSPYTPFSDVVYPLDDHGDETYNGEAVRPTYENAKKNLEHIIPVLADGLPSQRTQGFRNLADFIDWAHGHQITVLATFPNVVHQPIYDEPNSLQAITSINEFYSAHGVPLVGTAQAAMLPIGDFFDFMYHPTHEQALKRTERLIPELKPYLHLTK